MFDTSLSQSVSLAKFVNAEKFRYELQAKCSHVSSISQPALDLGDTEVKTQEDQQDEGQACCCGQQLFDHASPLQDTSHYHQVTQATARMCIARNEESKSSNSKRVKLLSKYFKVVVNTTGLKTIQKECQKCKCPVVKSMSSEWYPVVLSRSAAVWTRDS